MSARSRRLAVRFAIWNHKLIAAAQRCLDAQWRAICPAEGWSVGVTVHHVADDYAALLEVFEAIAAGRPVPTWTWELLNQRNANHARQFDQYSQDETIALLRYNGAAMADTIRRLSDEQLVRTGHILGREVSVAQVIELFLLGHIRSHLASIRAATASV